VIITCTVLWTWTVWITGFVTSTVWTTVWTMVWGWQATRLIASNKNTSLIRIDLGMVSSLEPFEEKIGDD
jgi:hypothetical protein